MATPLPPVPLGVWVSGLLSDWLAGCLAGWLAGCLPERNTELERNTGKATCSFKRCLETHHGQERPKSGQGRPKSARGTPQERPKTILNEKGVGIALPPTPIFSVYKDTVEGKGKNIQKSFSPHILGAEPGPRWDQ